jgi:Domain of unknown function (DUF4383)
MKTRYFALAAGIIYLLVGIVGFIPASLSPAGVVGHEDTHGVAVTALYGRLMGLFPVNVLHNLVHVLIGIWGIVAYRSFDRARTYAKGLAIIYALFAVMGLIPGLNTVFGLVPLYGHDVWLHALTALVAAYFGWGVTETAADGDRVGTRSARV